MKNIKKIKNIGCGCVIFFVLTVAGLIWLGNYLHRPSSSSNSAPPSTKWEIEAANRQRQSNIRKQKREESINVTMELFVFDFQKKITVKCKTNLPPDTKLILSLKNDSGYHAQNSAVIPANGSIPECSFFNEANFPNANYTVEALMPIPKYSQSPSVIAIIGANGEHITGNLVKKNEHGEITVEYKKDFKIDRDADTEQSRQSMELAKQETKKYKKYLREMLSVLVSFKSDADFQFYGFGQGGKYNSWLKTMEQIQHEINKSPYFDPSFKTIPGIIIQIGMDYTTSRGQETNYTREMLPNVQRAIEDQ